MNETPITVVGRVATDVTLSTTPQGIEISTFRIATTTRRFDRVLQQWVAGDTSFLKVTCWRRLGRNVAESIVKGDPVIVSGHVKVREWVNSERQGSTVEVDATSVGHNLEHGVGRFTRTAKRASAPENSPEAPDARAAA